MFGSYSAAGIADGDLEAGIALGKRNLNRTVLRSKPQRVIEEISDRALEQVRVRMNLAFSAAADGDASLFRDCLIKRRNFIHCCARIESLSRDWFTRRVHA